ncbi:uncharacterized protein [Elaeis guineensis]|uniref:uncharacterized protein n=1 Tax=Elaeis guineensis var. tenera TaxID=51953 RepID=UPI003C6D1710
MGSSYSSHGRGDSDDGDDDEEERGLLANSKSSQEKVLEQEPEVLPCRAAASPLSPQLSIPGTPRLLGPSVRIWDPCNVLLPSPLPASAISSGGPMDWATEVLLIAHGEWEAGLRPDRVGGRWPAAGLTPKGERQARALAVFLKSQGLRFTSVYTSPLDRARATATFICQELGFAEEQIKSSDALVEISQGQWEGCLQSEVYTPDIVSLVDRSQPDFSAPSGESLRQVEFRMIEFLNRTVLRLPEKLAIQATSMHQNETKEFCCNSSTNSVHDRDGPHWDLLYRHNQPFLQRKKSGKSRLQFVTTGDNETEDEFSHGGPARRELLCEANTRNLNTSIGIFTHAVPIKCLLTGLLNCSPVMSHKICIDDSSVTLLQHSQRTGWQIKKLNDTAHLKLL